LVIFTVLSALNQIWGFRMGFHAGRRVGFAAGVKAQPPDIVIRITGEPGEYRFPKSYDWGNIHLPKGRK